MSGDQPKPKPVTTDATTTTKVEAPDNDVPLVSDQDMEYYSGVMNSLRGGKPNPSSLPDVGYFDSNPQGATDTLTSSAQKFLNSLEENPGGPLNSDPDLRFQLGEPMEDPVNRADWVRYEAPDGSIRLRPREDQPRRPGEIPPKLAKELRQVLDDLALHPPGDTGKLLPSPEEQARLKEQAKYIAGTIGRNGNLNAEDLDSMFESATRDGEDNLNFLVKSVNEELKKTHPELKLQYSFDTESAWYSKDTHGADNPQEVQENRSTVGLVRSTSQQNIITQHIQDRIKSVASMAPADYIKTGDPNSRLILLE